MKIWFISGTYMWTNKQRNRNKHFLDRNQLWEKKYNQQRMWIKKRKLQDIQKSMPTEKTRAAKYK